MLRRTLQLFSTMALATTTAAMTTACDPGVYELGPADAATQGGTPDAPPQSGTPDAAAIACEEPSTLGLNGFHNAGQPCQSCHFTGAGGAPQFTLAGTLYGNSTGGTGVVGATIIVTDANNVPHKIITGTFGNFWYTGNLAYPVKVSSSLCPDSIPMSSSVASPGDCNSQGCHSLGAPIGRVHLP